MWRRCRQNKPPHRVNAAPTGAAFFMAARIGQPEPPRPAARTPPPRQPPMRGDGAQAAPYPVLRVGLTRPGGRSAWFRGRAARPVDWGGADNLWAPNQWPGRGFGATAPVSISHAAPDRSGWLVAIRVAGAAGCGVMALCWALAVVLSGWAVIAPGARDGLREVLAGRADRIRGALRQAVAARGAALCGVARAAEGAGPEEPSMSRARGQTRGAPAGAPVREWSARRQFGAQHHPSQLQSIMQSQPRSQ